MSSKVRLRGLVTAIRFSTLFFIPALLFWLYSAGRLFNLDGLPTEWGGSLLSRYFHEVTISGATYPLTLHDPVGRTMLIEAPLRRIISVTLGYDERLSALIDE